MVLCVLLFNYFNRILLCISVDYTFGVIPSVQDTTSTISRTEHSVAKTSSKEVLPHTTSQGQLHVHVHVV